MILPTTKDKLQHLYELQDSYRPNESIASQLAEKSIILMVGATCQGKTTIMQEVIQLNSGFGICGTFTSRAPRSDDVAGLYTYYENSDAGLAPILQRIAKQSVVNYAVNPFSSLLYGSELSDYPHRYNIGDFLSSAVEPFKRLGFGRSTVITVISNPESWLKRFNERFPVGSEQRNARRDEAIQSFTWSLAQPSGEHFWVENFDSHPEKTAQTVIDISLGESLSDEYARALCEQNLAIVKELQ